MGNLTREEILARRTGRAKVVLTDGASTVDVRGLTRDEVMEAQQSGRSLAEVDTFIIARGLVDPKMSEEDVAEFAATAPAGDLVAISNAIAELSGLTPDAGKAAYKSVAG